MKQEPILLTRDNLIAASSLDYDDKVSRKRYDKNFIFHTRLEPRPYAVFDLGRVVFAEKLNIINRSSTVDINQRARTLKVQLSIDLINWTPCTLANDADWSSFCAIVAQNIRFLHVSLATYGPLHLRSIVVDGVDHPHPDCTFALHGEYGFFSNREYFATHNAGIFSIASVTLLDLMRHTETIERIDATFALSYYKDDPALNIWGELFALPSKSDSLTGGRNNYFTKRLVQHDRYEQMDLALVLPFVRRYFDPSENVKRRLEAMKRKYGIDPSRTLLICFRGTDKHTEIRPAPIEAYITKAEEILKIKPWLRIMIQTDQTQIRQLLLEHFGERAFAVEELPTTESTTVVHRLLENNKSDFAANFVAVTVLMSECDEVITHTGNVAYWTVLYRGSTHQLYQL